MKIIALPKIISSGILNSQLLKPWGRREDVVFYDRHEILKEEGYNTVKSVVNLFLIRRQVTEIYCRDIYSFIAFFFMKPIFKESKIIYDFRGMLHEESFMRNGSRIRRQLIKWMEKFCFYNADSVRAVSKNMSRELQKSFGSRTVDIVPCCISKSEIITDLSVRPESSCLRFIYIGSIATWQCFKDAMLIYSEIECEKSLIVYTPNVVEAKDILAELSIECVPREASREEIIDGLRKSDFGFVLREDNLVNIVASPVKFLEYTSQGVVPICTDFVGDYSKDFSDLVYTLSKKNQSLCIEKLNALKGQENKRLLVDRSKLYTWEKFYEYFK